MKWRMITSRWFEMDYNGYHVDLKLGGIYPMWMIIKDGLLIDDARFNSPVTSYFNKELAAKAMVEKILKTLP